jgi:anti-sigma regulatory factor (Ser/Thr protein kinase)
MHLADADLEITLPARPENVAVVRHLLGGVGDALGVDPEILDDIRLAVSEACTNAVVHAYEDSSPGHVDVIVTNEGADLDVVVRDHGRGMAPRADSPGLGVGLPLIASLARALELSATEGGGTEVRMTFGLRAAAFGEHPAPAATHAGDDNGAERP